LLRNWAISQRWETEFGFARVSQLKRLENEASGFEQRRTSRALNALEQMPIIDFFVLRYLREYFRNAWLAGNSL